MEHEQFTTRPPRRGPSTGTVILLAIIFGAVAGFGGTILALKAYQDGKMPFLQASEQNISPLPININTPSGNGGGSSETFAQVADKLDESVVNINTIEHQQNPMAFFFGGGGSQELKGLGTGIIVDGSGYILTNYHVVGKADNITVTVMHKGGKRQYKAEMVGGDQQEDLAVIKINAKDLHSVRFGNSDAMHPGEWVMAIGNPFGFEHTVSVGVISALNRSLPVDDAVTLRDMLQTDASINPGNSGGPLVNLNGEVIGINSAIYVGQGNEPSASRIGFAIPSNHAKKIMELLRKSSTIPHPYIGISFSPITDELRTSMHLPVKDGVIVEQVLPDGPAGKAGLKHGDVITSVDGKSTQDTASLGDYISTQDVGKQIHLDVLQWNDASGQWDKKNIGVTIGNKPANFNKLMQTPQQQNTMPMPQGMPFP